MKQEKQAYTNENQKVRETIKRLSSEKYLKSLEEGINKTQAYIDELRETRKVNDEIMYKEITF